MWGPRELARLALVRADVVERATRVRDRFEKETGVALYVISGWRPLSEQAKTYADSLAEGFRAAPPEDSFHPLGAAIDFGIVGHVTTAEQDQNDPLYAVLARIMVDEGLRAGFNFKHGRPDPYHGEVDETLEVARATWKAITRERLRRTGVAGGLVAAFVILLVLVSRLRK